MRILIVEDNPLLAILLKEELKIAGHDVVGPVDTFNDAITIARSKPPELALVNIDLKHGDSGVNVARVLKEDLHCPTLFVSGSWLEARRARDIALGFIAKPYDVEVVLKSVEVASLILSDRVPEHVPRGLELFQRSWTRPKATDSTQH